MMLLDGEEFNHGETRVLVKNRLHYGLVSETMMLVKDISHTMV